MGKNITEHDRTIDKTHVGGVVYMQADQPARLEFGGKVFIAGSRMASKENGDFGEDLVDYLNDNLQSNSTSSFSLSSETYESYKNVYLAAPKSKNYHWHEEIVLGDYSYFPVARSQDYGNTQNRYLTYLRVDGTNQTISRHQINYVGANTPVDTSQTNAGFLMVSTGTKFLAYFRTTGGWDCHTSTDGLTWIDETSSFSLATTLNTSSIYTQAIATCSRNSFRGLISQNSVRYHSVTSFGSSFIWIGNDGSNFKIWKSSDALSWTDITSSIYPGAGTITDNYYYNVCIDRSISKAFIFVRNSSQAGETYCAYTTDGGNTWSQGTGDALTSEYVPEYLYKNPLDEDKFLIQSGANNALLTKTEDFGATWTNITAPRSVNTTYGIAYFGDYIYFNDTSSQGWPNYSPDNGANYYYFEEFFEDTPRFATDASRVIIVDNPVMMYSTDNITWNTNYSPTDNYFKDECVAIDANTTIFSNNDDASCLITTDGCVTFKIVNKMEEITMRFGGIQGISAKEIGYLENAKMIGHVKDDQTSEDNNLLFVERLKDPQWANTPAGTLLTAEGDLETYFRTK